MIGKELQWNSSLCKQWLDENKHLHNCEDNYEWIHILRICVICFSSLLLVINITLIIIRKQYKFNTIKLFMFAEVFYVLSLMSVVPHNTSFNLDMCEFVNGQDFSNSKVQTKDFYNCIIYEGSQIPTAVEGFVNLVSYALSYWFAVCITLYIKHVLQNTHKKFMLKRGCFICLVCLGIVIWYAVPFGLAFAVDVPFSFGPTGYKFYSKSQFFFYGGIVNRKPDQWVGTFLVILWMLTLPIVMFFYHIRLLLGNRKAIKDLMQLQDLNPRQFFIVKSGRLSIFIFIVQIVNVLKLGFSLIANIFTQDTQDTQDNSPQSQVFQWLILIINTGFDFMALLLIYIYFRHYYREGRHLQERSQVMDSSLVSSFNAPAI